MNMRFLIVGFLLSLSPSFAQKIEVVLQTGHAKQITGISISNDGMYFATAGEDKTIKIWDTETGAIIKNFEGHSKRVCASTFTQNSNYIISSGADSKVLLWQINQNIDKSDEVTFEEASSNYSNRLILSKAAKKEQTLGNFKNMFHGPGGKIISCDISSDKSKKIGLKEDGTVVFWESNTKFKATANSGLNNCRRIFFSPDGKKYYIVSNDKIAVWSTKEGAKPKIIPTSNDVKKVIISTDRELIGTLSNSGDISVYSAKKLKLITHIKSLNARHISFGRNNDEVLYLSGKDIGRYNFVSNTNTQIGTCDKSWSHFSYSSKFQYVIGVINENEIVARSTRNGSLVYNKPSVNIDYQTMKISPNWNYLINTSADEGYVQVSDITHAKTELILPGRISNAEAIALSDNFMAIPLSIDEIVIYELKNLNAIQSIKVKNGNIAGSIINDARDELITWEDLGVVEVYNLITGENTFHINLSEPIHQVELHDRTHCIATYVDGKTERFSLNTNESHNEFQSIPNSAIAISNNGQFMAIETDNNSITIHDLNNNLEIGPYSKLNKSKVKYFTFSNTGEFLVAVYENEQIAILETETGFWINKRSKGRRLCKAFKSSFSPDDKLLFLVNHDFNVLFWSWDTRPTPGDMKQKRNLEFEHRLVLSPDGTIIQTNKNYYIAAGNGHELLKFRKNDQVYSFDQFDLHYNRPDKVLEQISLGSKDLIDIYNKAYNKRLERLGFKNSRVNNSYHLPKLIITNKQDIPFESTSKKITINVKCEDSKVNLHLIKVYVNGVPINPNRGVRIPAGKKYFEVPIEVELSVGNNQIEVSCVNAYTAESYKTTIFTKYIDDSHKPSLYILSVGTSKYMDHAQDLYYASKDARDFVKAMSSSKDTYDKIIVNSLEDEQVNKASIKKALDQLKSANVDDHVYIFIAGHGQLDPNFDYYIATHDMDFSNPATNGYSYDELENSLEFIPSRHKVLFIDACHSGEIDKSGVTMVKYERKEEGKVNFRAADDTKIIPINNTLDMMKELFNDLENSSGTTIISSAGGGEFAIEGAEWSNGVFTYCLLEGINKLNADKNHDGRLMLSELFSYLTHRVPEITKGNQQPTSRAMNMKNDIRVK